MCIIYRSSLLSVHSTSFTHSSPTISGVCGFPVLYSFSRSVQGLVQLSAHSFFLFVFWHLDVNITGCFCVKVCFPNVCEVYDVRLFVVKVSYPFCHHLGYHQFQCFQLRRRRKQVHRFLVIVILGYESRPVLGALFPVTKCIWIAC